MKAIAIIQQEFSQRNESLRNQKVQIFENEQKAKEELKRIKKILQYTPTFKITLEGEGILSFENLTARYNFIITKL